MLNLILPNIPHNLGRRPRNNPVRRPDGVGIPVIAYGGDGEGGGRGEDGGHEPSEGDDFPGGDFVEGRCALLWLGDGDTAYAGGGGDGDETEIG